jgi:hypothetical protein
VETVSWVKKLRISGTCFAIVTGAVLPVDGGFPAR